MGSDQVILSTPRPSPGIAGHISCWLNRQWFLGSRETGEEHVGSDRDPEQHNQGCPGEGDHGEPRQFTPPQSRPACQAPCVSQRRALAQPRGRCLFICSHNKRLQHSTRWEVRFPSPHGQRHLLMAPHGRKARHKIVCLL